VLFFFFFFGLEKMDVCVRCRERKHGETLLFVTLCFSLYLLIYLFISVVLLYFQVILCIKNNYTILLIEVLTAGLSKGYFHE